MNYQELVTDMLMHLGENLTPENHIELVRALGFGPAQSAALVKDHQHMHQFIDKACTAIHHEACDAHKKRYAQVTQENMLNAFVPEKFDA